MKNNSFVLIQEDKLAEIIKRCCPPNKSVDHGECLAYEDCDGRSCIECWESWLKDGE